MTAIEWLEQGDRTEVVIRTDAPLDDDVVNHLVLSSPPRILVRLVGVDREYLPYTTEVGTATVERVRAGLHREFEPPQLYVVVDLASADVSVSSLELDGSSMHIVITP